MTRSWHGEDLAALTPLEYDQRRHDEDEQHGRYQVVDHAARTSIPAA
jgi:hypothetical protein